MSAVPRTGPTFFATRAEFRAWLDAYAGTADELWVGFHKQGSGLPSITWPEAVDEALCVGWIDGVRKRVDATSYMIRFTPRRPGSTWSRVNIDRVAVLAREGRLRPAGQQAYDRRTDANSGIYSYENRHEAVLEPGFAAELAANPVARDFFESRPRWYRQAAITWVMSAKREETRRRRLATLVEDSAAGRTVGPLTRPGG